jgi:quercetin dioxygenase-like cupin family protein
MTDPTLARFVDARQGTPTGMRGMIAKVPAASHACRVSVSEAVIPPGMFVPPHVHAHEDEFCYVLEGELRFLVGDEAIVARPGSYVVRPRGVRHAFWNESDEPARVIEIVAPGNLEPYFAELGAIFQADAPFPERKRAASALHERYGIHYDAALERAVVERFGIRVEVPR